MVDFKAIDIFGAPVSVNFQGDGEYKTRPGAFFSLITWVACITYAVVQGMACI